MFNPLLEAIHKAGAPLREHAPTVLEYARRYVEAKEREAQALSYIADQSWFFNWFGEQITQMRKEMNDGE